MGRAPELEIFEKVWERVTAGQRQIVFIGGEPGAGKTRLAAEVAGVLHSHGVAGLLGVSTQDAGVPYQAFAEILDQIFLAAEPGSLADHVTLAGADLGRLSGYAERHASGAVPSSAPTEVRRDLFDAVVGLLRALCGEAPLLLVLDDLHWAQRPTMALLDHLAREAVNVPLLIIGTFRTTAPDRSDELAHRIAEMHRQEGVRRLDLGGLDTDAIAEYIARQAGLSPSSVRAPAALLRDRTGGNPFFLRELWTDLEAHGGVSALSSSSPLRVPASIGDTVELRLAGLGPSAREIVDVAAVVGDDFDVSTVAIAGAVEPRSVLDALDSATAVGLVAPTALGEATFAFIHSLTRAAVLARLAPSKLALLHSRVGSALESRADDPSVVPRIAHHFLAAHVLGHNHDAIRYATRAGELAEASLAFEEAAVWYERAGALPGSTSEDRSSLLFAAGANHLRAGDFARARGIYERLATVPDPKVRLRAAMGYEDANWRPGLANTKAADLLASALSDSDLDRSDSQYLWALGSLGRALAFAGETDRARALGSHAIAAAEDSGDAPTVMHALKTSLWHGLGPEMADVQLARATRLCAMAREAEDFDTLGSAAYFRAMAAYVRGDPSALDEAAAHGRIAAERNAQPFFSYVAGCVSQGRALLAGDFTSASQWAGRTLRLGDSFGPDTTEGSYGVQMFMIARETGGLLGRATMVDGTESFESRWVPGMLALYTELENRRGIRRALDHLLKRDLSAQVHDAQWPMELVFMTEGALVLGDTAALGVLESHLLRYAGMNLISGQFVAPLGSADRFLARVAVALGRPDEAEARFTAAVALDRRMGSVIHEAESAAWHARFLVSRDPLRAATLSGRARELASRIGQVRVLRVLEPITEGHPDGLTDREVEVLGLLAAGLSNREIADRLYISPNTAANHVRSILMKTRAANRTQAAVYATEHDLA